MRKDKARENNVTQKKKKRRVPTLKLVTGKGYERASACA